jgi:hypothetical protein
MKRDILLIDYEHSKRTVIMYTNMDTAEVSYLAIDSEGIPLLVSDVESANYFMDSFVAEYFANQFEIQQDFLEIESASRFEKNAEEIRHKEKLFEELNFKLSGSKNRVPKVTQIISMDFYRKKKLSKQS